MLFDAQICLLCLLVGRMNARPYPGTGPFVPALSAVSLAGPLDCAGALELPVGAYAGAVRRPSPLSSSNSTSSREVSVTATDPQGLVNRARTGDLVAFRELFHRHRPDVTRLVFRLMGRTADLEDITQDVFLQVYRSLPEFRGDAKFSTWLHRVTVNVVLMARRSARSRPSLVFEEPEVYDGELLPDEGAARRERLRAFARCIDKLAEKKRTAFLLHDVEGVPAAEVATMVEAPVLTVRTRLFYARKELGEHMRDEPALAAIAERIAAGEKSSRR